MKTDGQNNSLDCRRKIWKRVERISKEMEGTNLNGEAWCDR
jgi:hypothetical protein